MARDQKQYELMKGYEILATGTLEEIAKKIGVKRDTVAFYKTPTYKKRSRNSENRRQLFELEYD